MNPEKLFSVNIKTSCGTFRLQATSMGLRRLVFPGRTAGGKAVSRAAAGAPAFLGRAASRIRDFLEGGRPGFRDLPMDLSGYSDFEKKVLKCLLRTRVGETLTYGDLARRAGSPRSARAVGNTMRKNRLPVMIPCHRVILSDGRLGRYTGGDAWKKRLLDLEKKP